MLEQGMYLFISYQDPFGRGGGCYAAHAYLKAFSKITNGCLDLVLADSCNPKNDDSFHLANIYKVPARNKLQIFKSFIWGDISRYTQYVANLIKNKSYSCIIFSGSLACGKLVKLAKDNGIKTITIHHNFEAEYFRDNYRNLILRTVLVYHVKRSERISYFLSDYNFFLTESDRKLFLKEYGETKGKACLMGIFEYSENTIKKVIHSSRKDIVNFVITGTLSSVQGEDGVLWFLDEYYSLLPQNSLLYIAGANPTRKIVDRCSKLRHVKLIANPKNIDEIVENADVYICPTRLGGGLKLRIMDGLKSGLPVITHVTSARGYDMFFDKPFFKVYENCVEFKNGISEIIHYLERNSVDKSLILKDYNKSFSFESGLERIKSYILSE